MTSTEFLTTCMDIATAIDTLAKITPSGPRRDFLNQCKAPEVLQIAMHFDPIYDWQTTINGILQDQVGQKLDGIIVKQELNMATIKDSMWKLETAIKPNRRKLKV